jgi:peptidoglycan-associated lipoprotein
MTSYRAIQVLGLGLVLTVAVVGCKKKTAGVTPLPHSGLTGGEVNPGSGNPASGTEPGSGISSSSTPGESSAIKQENTHTGWNKDPETLKADTVHFDYDSTIIRSGEKSKVAHVADYLKGNPSVAVEVDGHCDERGTDEYNRALGERRALALREELVRLGVDSSRVDTVSFGRDKPVDTGHSEASHAKNRRGEFVVLTAPAGK